MRIQSDIKGLVNAETVDVEHGNRDAGKVFDLLPDIAPPLSQSILNKCELCDLALPFRVIAEGSYLAILTTTSAPLSILCRATLKCIPDQIHCRGIRQVVMSEPVHFPAHPKIEGSHSDRARRSLDESHDTDAPLSKQNHIRKD